MGKTYCCGLHPKGSVYLIAIIDIILGLVSFLLSVVALAKLENIFGRLESDEFDEDLQMQISNEIPTRTGIDEFSHMHGQMILVLLISLVFLTLALGLFYGVKKEVDCPIKCWLVYGCTLALLGIISLLVIAIVSDRFIWLFFLSFATIRVYEIWVVFDYLKHAHFCLLTSISRTPSMERLHNV